MKKASLLASATLAVFGNVAQADETYPEITTDGYENKIDAMIEEGCPASVFSQTSIKSEQAILCATTSWTVAYELASHLSAYIKENPKTGFQAFWDGAAQGELVGCETAVRNVNETLQNLDRQDPDKVQNYISKSQEVAINCLSNIDNAENGVEYWLDTPAQNHLIGHLNCMGTPQTCTRIPKHNP